MVPSKMRWSCGQSGCYLKNCEPNLAVFDKAFPRNIRMSDIDGIVEIKGSALYFEWKGEGGVLSKGQEIMLKKLTLCKGMIAFIVYGDTKTMEVHHYTIFWKGGLHGELLRTGTSEDVIDKMKKWADMADNGDWR